MAVWGLTDKRFSSNVPAISKRAKIAPHGDEGGAKEMRKYLEKAPGFLGAVVACLSMALGQAGFAWPAAAQTQDAVVVQVTGPDDSGEDLPQLPIDQELDQVDSDDSDEESVEIMEAVFERKTATGSVKLKKVKVGKLKKATAKKPAPAGIPEGKYPQAYADRPELIDVPDWCVGKEKILALGAHKAYAVKIVIPGLRPSNMDDPHKRYIAWGHRGDVTLVAQDDMAGNTRFLHIRPWLRLRAAAVGIFRGSITVFSTKTDFLAKRGEPLEFWWRVTSCGKAEPASAPIVLPPPPPPAPVVVPATPPPAVSTPAPYEPGDHVILDGVYTQGFLNRAGNLGDEHTHVTVGAEYQKSFGTAFGSFKLADAPSLEGWNPDLPIEQNDDLLQPSVHAGVRSGYDMLSAGLGLNVSLIPTQQGGISKHPASLILRAQKKINWFTTWRLSATTTYSWNNWFGYRAGVDAALSDSFGLTANVSGQVIDGNSGALPGAGVYLMATPDLRLSLSGGITGGSPALILTAKWDHELNDGPSWGQKGR